MWLGGLGLPVAVLLWWGSLFGMSLECYGFQDADFSRNCELPWWRDASPYLAPAGWILGGLLALGLARLAQGARLPQWLGLLAGAILFLLCALVQFELW
jgi:hypothetical protein